MASNIPIKLTGDNKSALAAISGVQKGLGNLGTGVDNLNKKMAAFTNALVGVGIVAFTRSLLASADQLQDMSDALDINTARLLEMGVAAAASGSSMEGLNSMLFKMEANIGAAVEGNGEMIDALRKVGISFSDVQNLKPDQIFTKISVALSKITDPMARTRLQTELFGKASKGFSAASFVSEIEKLYGTMDKYTKSTADAARISDSLGMFITLVKAEFLALLQPVLNIITPMTRTETAMDGAARAAKVLLGALLLFVSAQIINAITSVVGGIKSLASFMGLAAASTTAATKATLINANAQSYLAGAIGRLGTAQNALFTIERQLEIAEAKKIKDAVLIAKLTDQRTAAVARLELAEAALTKTSATANIALGSQVAATTAVTASTGLATRAVIGLRVAIQAMALAAAAFLARIAVFAVVLLPIIVLWKAFGDTITEYAVKAVNLLNEGLNKLANLLRRIAGQKPIEFKTLIPNAPFYPTPDGKPIPTTFTPGTTDGGGDFEKTQEKDAKTALAASLTLMQQQAEYAKQKNIDMKKGVAFAELELDIKKAIDSAEAQALKAGLGKNAVDRDGIRLALEDEAIAKVKGEMDNLELKAQSDLNLLSTKDTAQREIQAELMRIKQQYGVLLNKDQLENYKITLDIIQAEKERIALADALDRLYSKNIAKTPENALAGAGIAMTDMEKLQATYDLQSEQLKQALDRNLISQEAYTAAWQKIQLEQYNGELDLVIRNFDAKQQLREKEIQAEASKYADMLVQQKDFLGQQRFTYEEAKQIALDRARFEKKTDLEKTAFAIQQGADMFNALGAQNKKAFEIAKAFNIANAIMNTYLAATKALAQGGIFGFIGMAAAIAAGFAQVAAIRSQTFSGRALGGPMVGGQGYLVGEKGPEIFTPSTAGTMTPNDKLGVGGATNITFNIVANDTKGFDQLLVERRPLITKIIRDAQLEQGRRSL